MSERINAEKTKKLKHVYLKDEGVYFIDFTQEDSPLLEGLKTPIRKVEFYIGNVKFLVPRGADDPIPDNVIEIGGIFHNTSDGRIGKKVEDVM